MNLGAVMVAILALAGAPATQPATRPVPIARSPILEPGSKFGFDLIQEPKSQFGAEVVLPRTGGTYGFLGIVYRDTSPLTIRQVIPGMGADHAGLCAGDRIIEVRGVRTPDANTMANITRGSKPGSQLKMVVERDGVLIGFEVELMGVEMLDEILDRPTTRSAAP